MNCLLIFSKTIFYSQCDSNCVPVYRKIDKYETGNPGDFELIVCKIKLTQAN